MEGSHSEFSSEVLEVVVERILPGGMGLAHIDGRTLFVALSAPGDRLRVKIEKVKGAVAFASVAEILNRSPVRVEPPCPYFGNCGGCDFQQLSYAAQLDAKVEIIKDCLRRIGGLKETPGFQITPAPNQWHYRSRAQWQYDAAGKRLGYFASGSRRVCDVTECAVLVPELQEQLSSLRAEMDQGALPEERDFRAVVGDEGVSISPSVRSPSGREGSPHVIHRSIHGETYTLNAENFFQTNTDLLPQLIDAALADERGESAVELYSGVGLFTLPLARRFQQVIAVEGDTAAARYAQINLENAGLSHAAIAIENVGSWLAGNEHNPALASLDFLLLDPPRAGAESRVIAGILQLRPKRISYVACDPATLARDLKKLLAGGYSLDSIVAFDMFPQTHHVETVVRLST
ncbi:MAG TPA: class I SAM-dependent RNA methyltransferase [Pyrinomonadaceae bacterium]|nr:class I SAM-dependent RNA methyltransferase [Pyrinomonadaceae bacterium]